MTNKMTFFKEQEKNFKTLKQYVPVVARVHGGTHPVFYEVQRYFDAIIDKSNDKSLEKSALTEEFIKLREVTHDYMVPNDVCESYEAVYKLLEELDKAYHAL